MKMHASTTSSLQSRAKNNSGHGLLLQRQCACGGVCGDCRRKKQLQAKLVIGASNDPLEQEADRVAEQVLAGNAPANTQPGHAAIQATPPAIQRHTVANNDAAQCAPASVAQVLASPGQALQADLRQDMSRRFGHDFSAVRVHAGAAAAQSAREVDARAYTVGKQIVFDAGEYAPGSPSGRRLLAHELTHVVQQSGQGETAGTGPVMQRERARRPAAPAPAPAPAPAAQPGQHVIPCPDPGAVSAAITLARNILGTALRRMDAGPSNISIDPRTHQQMQFFYTLFFKVEPGVRSAAQILEIKERFRALALAARAATTRCVSAAHPDCRSGQMLHDGFADVGASQQPVVNLCPSFFTSPAEAQARTIIHELAHARLGIEHAGGRFLQFECGATPLRSYDEAIANAYVFDLFAYCLYASSQGEGRRAAP